MPPETGNDTAPHAGLVCHWATGDVGHYYFAVATDGNYGIQRVTGKEATRTPLAFSSTPSSAIRPAETNHVQVDCYSGGASSVFLVLSVNGTELLRVTDTDAGGLATSGGAGLELGTGTQTGFAAAFRNIVVTELLRP